MSTWPFSHMSKFSTSYLINKLQVKSLTSSEAVVQKIKAGRGKQRIMSFNFYSLYASGWTDPKVFKKNHACFGLLRVNLLLAAGPLLYQKPQGVCSLITSRTFTLQYIW